MAAGYIRQRGTTWQVIVHAGHDPITGKRRHLTGTAPTKRDAQALRARLLNQVNQGRRPATDATVAQLLARWLEVADPAWSTRSPTRATSTAPSSPPSGQVPLRRLDTAALDRFYTTLRARGGVGVRGAAGGGHRAAGPRDPAPRAGPGGPLGWLSANPAALASPPRPGPADLRPPTPQEVSRLLAAAYAADPDFAVLLWLAAATGARRGELCALRWSNVDVAAGELVIVRNLIVRGGQLVEKDTKTHAARRIALSDDSVALLAEHRRRCTERAQACDASLAAGAYVFSFDPAGPDEPGRGDAPLRPACQAAWPARAAA
jgi:integrase